MDARTVKTLVKYHAYINALYKSIIGAWSRDNILTAITHDIEVTGANVSDDEITDIVNILTKWGAVKEE